MTGGFVTLTFLLLLIMNIKKYKTTQLESSKTIDLWTDSLEQSQINSLQDVYSRRIYITKAEIAFSVFGLSMGIFLLFYLPII